jgi:hypothetical protein
MVLAHRSPAHAASLWSSSSTLGSQNLGKVYISYDMYFAALNSCLKTAKRHVILILQWLDNLKGIVYTGKMSTDNFLLS